MKPKRKKLADRLPLLREVRQMARSLERIEQELAGHRALLQERILQTLRADPRYQEPGRLQRFEHQVYSQNGEDGILAEIFRRIGVVHRYFVEIGVGEGLENNTVYWLTQGWRGFWVEGDPRCVARIEEQLPAYRRDGALRLTAALVTAENAAGLLEGAGVPVEFDLLSLDIDRNTYYAWAALRAWRPRVVLVEYNALYPPDCDWKVAYAAERGWNGTAYFGASLKAYERLAAELGYALVGCDLSGTNAFFVRSDLAGDRFRAPFTAENHYEPPRYWLLRRAGHPRALTD